MGKNNPNPRKGGDNADSSPRIDAKNAKKPAGSGGGEIPPELRAYEKGAQEITDLRACLGAAPDPKDSAAVEAARIANLIKTRLDKDLKYFKPGQEKQRVAKRKELLKQVHGSDLFELQSKRAYDETSLMFLRPENLVPTCGPISFKVDFDNDPNIEANIGLGTILPPTVSRVEVHSAKNGGTRAGTRKITNGRIGYYDAEGYIPVFTGDKVTILETSDPKGTEYKKQEEAEREYWKKLKDEYKLISQEESETEKAGSKEQIRLHTVLSATDPASRAISEDFNKMQETLTDIGIPWSLEMWMNGGAALKRLNGGGNEILNKPAVLEMFKLLSNGGTYEGKTISIDYAAHAGDVIEVDKFVRAVGAVAGRDRFLRLTKEFDYLSGYALMNMIRRFNDGEDKKKVGGIFELPGTEVRVESGENIGGAVGEARKYLYDVLAQSDADGREIYNNSVKTFRNLSASALRESVDGNSATIERLNGFGWANDSFAMFIDGNNQELFLLHKNSSGTIDFGSKFRVSMGRRDRLGSNVPESNGTPRGMLEWYSPRDTFDEMDGQPIGKNRKDQHKGRGRAGITTRWLRTRGLEGSDNGNSDRRGILFHGGGYMDNYRGGYEQSWVPRSRGCMVTSNADTMVLWSFIRQNMQKGQKVLCDVVV